jgi:hypothetical protein
VLAGSWTSSGNSTNEEYIPTPIRKATVLVVQTPRIAIIRMSTNGSRERSSSRTQAAITNIPRASRPSVLGEPQPHVLVSVIARSTPEMPTVISPAAR